MEKLLHLHPGLCNGCYLRKKKSELDYPIIVYLINLLVIHTVKVP